MSNFGTLSHTQIFTGFYFIKPEADLSYSVGKTKLNLLLVKNWCCYQNLTNTLKASLNFWKIPKKSVAWKS